MPNTLDKKSVARFFCNRSNWTISNLKLQKIMYLTQMMYVGETAGAPLFDGKFEAWMYGPVEVDLYHQLKGFGKDHIPPGEFPAADVIDEDDDCHEFLDAARQSLIHLSPARLIRITHAPGGAWAKRYHQGRWGAPITNEDMLDEYTFRFGKSK